MSCVFFFCFARYFISIKIAIYIKQGSIFETRVYSEYDVLLNYLLKRDIENELHSWKPV